MDKKALIQKEVSDLELTIKMVENEIKKYELIGNSDRVKFEIKSLGYIIEEKDKYKKMLAEMEE